MLDNNPISCKSLSTYYYVNGKRLEEQYRRHLSDFFQWEQLDHCEKWILFEENLGSHLSIDEVALSQGELYTVLTNKSARGKKGSIVAIISGTKSEDVIEILRRMPYEKRCEVKEVTLDMASTMGLIVKKSFPKASQVIDRFHVQKLAYDALQQIRIEHRWEAIEQENKEIQLAKESEQKFKPNLLENGDTHKQLLARSRYLLFKAKNKWTPKQHKRAELLFKYYPDLEYAYDITQELGTIYRTTKDKGVAYTKLAQWYNKVELSKFNKTFSTVVNTIQNHYKNILNFFENRSTNASAESFNAKIKAFRAQFRGVKSVAFFLFRLSKIYA
ncbi:MAG: transposase [Flavobacteriaceae bacterium]|nr:transposase [Flavobacteriaceae bacterium]